MTDKHKGDVKSHNEPDAKIAPDPPATPFSINEPPGSEVRPPDDPAPKAAAKTSNVSHETSKKHEEHEDKHERDNKRHR